MCVCLGCCRVLCCGTWFLTLSLQILGPVSEGWMSGYRLAESSALLRGVTGAVLALTRGDQECSVIGDSSVISYPVQPDFSSFLC